MVKSAMMMWSLRHEKRSTVEMLDAIADAGFDGVQFIGLFDRSEFDEIAETLERTGLEMIAPHVSPDPPEKFETDLIETIEMYESIGELDALIFNYLPEEYFETEEDTRDTIAMLNHFEKITNDQGLEFIYHNHDAEFLDNDGRAAFDILLENTDFDIELDVGWARTAGQDPVYWLDRVADRCNHLHMRDVAKEEGITQAGKELQGETDCILGKGIVDMHACARAAVDANIEWFIHERINPEYPETVTHGYEYLRSLS